MKKIIRHIAELTGVANKIRIEAYKEAGKRMQDYANWFNRGINTEGGKFDILNTLHEYPERCLKKGHANLYGSQHDNLREYLMLLSKRNESIIKIQADEE